MPGARFRIPVQNQAGALGSGLVGRDPPASVSGFPDPPAGISSSSPQFIWVPLPERYPGISAPGPGISALGLNRSRSCSRREKLEEVASWQRGQPSQRLPPAICADPRWEYSVSGRVRVVVMPSSPMELGCTVGLVRFRLWGSENCRWRWSGICGPGGLLLSIRSPFPGISSPSHPPPRGGGARREYGRQHHVAYAYIRQPGLECRQSLTKKTAPAITPMVAPMAIHDPGRESQCFFPEPLALNLFLALARFRLSCLFRPVAIVLSHSSCFSFLFSDSTSTCRWCSQLLRCCSAQNGGAKPCRPSHSWGSLAFIV